jgi:hypothetical protein
LPFAEALFTTVKCPDPDGCAKLRALLEMTAKKHFSQVNLTSYHAFCARVVTQLHASACYPETTAKNRQYHLKNGGQRRSAINLN